MSQSILDIFGSIWNFISIGIPEFIKLLSLPLRDYVFFSSLLESVLDSLGLGWISDLTVLSLLFGTSVTILGVVYVILPILRGIIGAFS